MDAVRGRSVRRTGKAKAEFIRSLQRTARHKEYRCYEDPRERAAHLVIDKLCGTRAAAEALGISESSVRRAMTAFSNCRDVGRVGQPPALTTEGTAELKKFVVESEKTNVSLTSEQIANKVNSSLRTQCNSYKC
jgi:hypothetical protein